MMAVGTPPSAPKRPWRAGRQPAWDNPAEQVNSMTAETGCSGGRGTPSLPASDAAHGPRTDAVHGPTPRRFTPEAGV